MSKEVTSEYILNIIRSNYNKFKGTNEAELQASDEIAELFNDLLFQIKSLESEIAELKITNNG